MKNYIKPFSDIRITDVPLVGGKNASLGEMYTQLTSKGIAVPNGFAITAEAFRYFLTENKIDTAIKNLLSELDRKEYANLKDIGKRARALLTQAQLPQNLVSAIENAYALLCGDQTMAVAVRSSATAEDLPNASFAGQHESYLNIQGKENVLKAVQRCFVSLYTDRAIKYREDNGFAHEQVALSVGIQQMVRSDKACSGVGFTLEPESGFRDLVYISGVWGLGENIVQGAATPDEFLVFKPTLLQGKKAIIRKTIGAKEKTMVYNNNHDAAEPVVNTDTSPEKQAAWVLTDEEIETLARQMLTIEQHYQKPMDIEWAKDGDTNQLFIIQARPETVQVQRNPYQVTTWHILYKGQLLTEGEAVGEKIASGTARILQSPDEADKLSPGEIVVTDITSPDWDPVLKKAAAIVTNKGGRTGHASIVAREQGVPAIVGTLNATEKIKDGQSITVSCCEGQTGFIYDGIARVKAEETDFSTIDMPDSVDPMLIVGDPAKAFHLSFYPNAGVGLMRMEFIITHAVQVHPMALVKFNELKDAAVKAQIEKLTAGYANKEKYFIDKLSQGIAVIAAAFYPKDVIVRMSDFKTNEYANLLGGKEFEPVEENPMLGFRGASRYYNNLYKEGFRLECEAIRMVRDEMGLTNVKVMIPFCRTVEEGKKVIGIMKQYRLEQGVNNLEVYVMAEIPSNVLLAKQFAEVFDGFSIGSNDLTQLTLGIDRDSFLIADLFNEQNEAVEQMISDMIHKAKLAGVKVGLCGQAPSDYPYFARFLVKCGIDSISFNPDALITGIRNIDQAEYTEEEELSAAME